MKMSFFKCAVSWDQNWDQTSWFWAAENVNCREVVDRCHLPRQGTWVVTVQPPHFKEKDMGRDGGFLENFNQQLAELS